MRFIHIIVLYSSLILSASSDDPSENEINDEITRKKINEGAIENGTDDDDSEIVRDISEEKLNLEEIYKNSVQAYLDEDWDRCIEGFTEAVGRYKEYKKAVIKCRRNCREIAIGSQPIFPENIEDMHFYEKKVRETLCLLHCNQDFRDTKGSDYLKRLPKVIEKKFVDLAPYEYLQMCYYQKNRFQDAANAVYTYLTANPKHDMSIKNLEYYIDLPDVDEARIVNLEVENFVAYYSNGVNAYEEEHYREAINNLESSLARYIGTEEDCRYYCEGHFDQGWLPEFTTSVANHFAYCLKCKQNCSIRMNYINGKYYDDLLPSHYNYLQFAYYKVGDLKNACAAVASFLLFYPGDETMLKNERYYSNLPSIETDYFTPRREAIEYIKRQEYEKKLSRFILEEFRIIGSRINAARLAIDEIERERAKTQVNPEIRKETI